jgi:pyrroline-5-carboxylate reductase
MNNPKLMNNPKPVNNNNQISFIGCGNMTTAIIHGLIGQGMSPSNIQASNRSPEKLTKINASTNILTTTDNYQAAKFADILILAVKPQILPQICEQLKSIDLSNKLIISVAAGITTDKILKLLEQPVAVIRAMPNTPATISEGATGLFANQQTSQSQKHTAESIFLAIGQAEWVEQESLIDVVTAIAGSAPAYVFLFIQAMVEQAVEDGLDEKCARNLATQAVLGASKLAQIKSGVALQDLRQAVTSPGGTTAAAIASFEQNDFSNIIKKAVYAATTRGKELGEQA